MTELPADEIAKRRLLLAIGEIGACLTDMVNLSLQSSSSPMKRGGITLGLQRAMLAVQNRSFAEFMREPQLHPTDGQGGHVYLDPLLDLIGLLNEFLPHVGDSVPFKAQVVETLAQFDMRTQLDFGRIDGVTIRLHTKCRFTYRNWKNEVEVRYVRPMRVYWGTTEYYPEPGWLMHAFDVEKNQLRDFSLARMTDVEFSA